MVTQQTIRLVREDGTEEVVEVDQELWDRFAARAKELGVPEQDLFITAMSDFLKGQGYDVTSADP